MVKLSPENRFGGDDSGQTKPGEWVVLPNGANDIDLRGFMEMCGNSEAQVDECVFARGHHGVEGLFVPVMVAKPASSEFGPFTYDQVVRMWRW